MYLGSVEAIPKMRCKLRRWGVLGGVTLTGEASLFMNTDCTWVISELPEANLYRVLTTQTPATTSSPLLILREFSCWWVGVWVGVGATGRSDGHLLALLVPWPLGMLGMYCPSVHSHNLPGFRLRQERRERRTLLWRGGRRARRARAWGWDGGGGWEPGKI